MSLAPGAQVVVYDGPFNGRGSFQTMFNAMINDGVNVISNSWAYCEDQTTVADVQSIDSILASAGAAGITVLNGSGDNGSTCLNGSSNTCHVPASSPNATAVGGPPRTEASAASTATRPGGIQLWADRADLVSVVSSAGRHIRMDSQILIGVRCQTLRRRPIL
jgi:subtilase family serine protease